MDVHGSFTGIRLTKDRIFGIITEGLRFGYYPLSIASRISRYGNDS